jgi:CRP/FNR family transcriptional regulator, cyclic AMP receptor protein
MSKVQISQLSPELQQMLEQCHRKRFDAKSLIMRAGEKSNNIYFILEGSVSVHAEDEDGHELILDYIGPGYFVGELGLFLQESQRSARIRARSECEVAYMAYPKFKELYQDNPALLLELTQQIANRLLRTSRKVSNLAFMDVTGRIAHTLLELASDTESITHPDGKMIKITREELGRLVNCSREVAGKVLKGLEEQGLIQIDGRRIVIHEPGGD